MAFPRTPDSITKHKAMYKLTSSMPWKDNYKKRCAERLRSSRSKLLNRFRNVTDICERNSLDDVMHEEWQKMMDEFDSKSDSEHELHFDDVLKTMEEVKAELLEWETEILLEYENKAMDADVYQHDFGIDEHKVVVCPVCNNNYIQVHLGSVRCECGLRIDMGQDSIGVHHIKTCLEQGVTEHLQNCSTAPAFNVVESFGCTNLLLTCSACDYMFIVI
ncbi:RPA-interacting protein B-like [Clavelina lepadiformis]|uniref:RPA-interacting protein B-like n=1 Tax=Clavelina lepadiformis TaxID=159417 RepID=UPI0040433BC1